MLKSSDKKKIENYIQKVIDGLLKDARESIDSGMNDKQIIERITKATVNKFVPESKMIMSSVYNMMMDKTLSEEQFQNSENKSAFYQRNILEDLNSKFSFDVPDKIDYLEDKNKLDKWIKSGSAAVAIIGGAASVKFRNFIFLGISIVAILVTFISMNIQNENNRGRNKTNINLLISEYLSSVKESLMEWIESIENYYDECVDELKKGMNP